MSTPGSIFNKIIDTFPLTQYRIQAFSLFNGLVGPGGVDFKGCLAVHPVVCAAKTGSFGAYGADMAGCKRLAEGAGVVNFLFLVSHGLDPLVPQLVFTSGPFRQLVDILLLGVQRHLDLVQDLGEILMEFGMQDNANVF